MDVEKELPIAHAIMHTLLRICKPDWKTRDQCKSFLTEGKQAVLRTYRVRDQFEPLLRALLAAASAAHGTDDHRTIRARVDLGEVLASAASVQKCPDQPGYVKTVRWGEVPAHGDAESLLGEALSAVRRIGREMTSPLAVRTATARAGWLAQCGHFAKAAALLREVLEAFTRRDGGYTSASWGGDHDLAHQIQCVVRHTRKHSRRRRTPWPRDASCCARI